MKREEFQRNNDDDDEGLPLVEHTNEEHSAMIGFKFSVNKKISRL